MPATDRKAADRRAYMKKMAKKGVLVKDKRECSCTGDRKGHSVLCELGPLPGNTHWSDYLEAFDKVLAGIAPESLLAVTRMRLRQKGHTC